MISQQYGYKIPTRLKRLAYLPQELFKTVMLIFTRMPT